MNRRKFWIVAAFAFFFGFPLVGMMYVYGTAHTVMRDSAVSYAKEEIPRVFREKDFDGMLELGTLTLKGQLDSKAIEAWGGFGEFQKLGEFKVTRSTVSSRSDQGWQLVNMEAPMTFSKTMVRLKLRTARRSVMLEEWRIEEISLEPENVE